jgi:hypothetical protein
MIIELSFTFRLRSQLVAGREQDPRICFHLPADLGHQMVIIDPRRERPEVCFKLQAPDSGEPFIARDAALHCWQFSSVYNSNRELSTNEAGYAMIPLEQVLSNTRDSSLEQELVVMNARHSSQGLDPVKGRLTLSFRKSSFPKGRSPFLPAQKYDITAQNQEFVVGVLSNYVQSCNSIYERKSATFDSIRYLHLPLWSYGAYSVSGAAFGMPRAQPSPESWWHNASRIALRRHYPQLSLAQAEQRFLGADETEVMAVVSKMHTAVVNHVATYLSDGVYLNTGHGQLSEQAAFADLAQPLGGKLIKRRRTQVDSIAAHSERSAQFVNMEAFTLGRMRVAAHRQLGADNSGDCEDDAGEITLQAMELRNLRTSDPVLQRMRDVRRNYVILQLLLGVRGAQLSDSQGSDSEHRGLGGHMAAMYMSKEQFLSMHRKYNHAEPLYEGMQVGSNSSQRAAPMILEGTGLVDPACSTEYAASLPQLRYLLQDSGSAFDRIKFIQPQSRTQLNAFYRAVQSFVCPDLADERYSAIEHVVMKNRNGHITTGADWLEFLNGDPTIATYSMPHMSQDEIMITKRILNQRFPIVAYEAPLRRPEQSANNPHLDAVAQFAKQLGRQRRSDCVAVDFFPRYTQVNEELSSQWQQLLKRKHNIVGFEYFDEHLGPQVGGYLARFYVSK